jgi:hypothetical protein
MALPFDADKDGSAGRCSAGHTPHPELQTPPPMSAPKKNGPAGIIRYGPQVSIREELGKNEKALHEQPPQDPTQNAPACARAFHNSIRAKTQTPAGKSERAL